VAAVDGTIYFINANAIQKRAPDGTITTIAKGAAADAPLPLLSFQSAMDLALATDGQLYVADKTDTFMGAPLLTPGQAPGIWRVDPDSGQVTLVAGVRGAPAGAVGPVDGQGSEATFNMIRGLCAASDGNLYVEDVPLGIRQVTPQGQVTTLPRRDGDFGLLECGYGLQALGSYYVNGDDETRYRVDLVTGQAYGPERNNPVHDSMGLAGYALTEGRMVKLGTGTQAYLSNIYLVDLNHPTVPATPLLTLTDFGEAPNLAVSPPRLPAPRTVIALGPRRLLYRSASALIQFDF
jgi:hypothetical protein